MQGLKFDAWGLEFGLETWRRVDNLNPQLDTLSPAP